MQSFNQEKVKANAVEQRPVHQAIDDIEASLVHAHHLFDEIERRLDSVLTPMPVKSVGADAPEPQTHNVSGRLRSHILSVEALIGRFDRLLNQLEL